MNKAKRRLTDIKFEDEGSHVALVFAAQGGPANGVTTLITKATSDMSEADVQQLLHLEKARFNSEVRNELSEALRDKFASGYEWLYFMDFSDTEILFETDAGMFTVGYSLSSDGEYTFDDTAKGFEYELVQVDNGKVKLSVEAQSKLSEGEYVLVNKALEIPENSERVEKALNALTEKKRQMEVEIQKAVEAKDAEIATLKAEMEKLQNAVAQFESAQKEQVLKARETKAEEFIGKAAVDLVKSTAELSDEAFASVLSALSVQKAAVAESELMTEVSDPAAKSVERQSETLAIIKSKFPQ